MRCVPSANVSTETNNSCLTRYTVFSLRRSSTMQTQPTFSRLFLILFLLYMMRLTVFAWTEYCHQMQGNRVGRVVAVVACRRKSLQLFLCSDGTSALRVGECLNSVLVRWHIHKIIRSRPCSASLPPWRHPNLEYHPSRAL